ncbi:murein L,D-transpeptidase catalytic domain family protein [Pacificimonas sp. WHA3]|uniref:Murein L,D-transpeptidase catalytic domain family protein n=1 Tax=Pacificimonas pallii TaxID=2827236 RepID=A0ABS6SER8_9SPHN|nr:murein L,D-transpeptidase catalytic domain family protein [Pacificimonas pallii]MBV7256593.1 murein L,D-transpeptidase catalytic domain family protein [Pacificimonas pallii]
MDKSTMTRRRMITLAAAAAAAARALPARAASAARPRLLDRALAALDRHGDIFTHRDRIGIADFASPSGTARFHIVDIASGAAQSLLVAHGSGSDPDHSGFLQRFSNRSGSHATSSGAYLTTTYYRGKYGRSLRLAGLDDSNSNAEPRAIVVHGAWYVDSGMARDQGRIGRSQGCFAFEQSEIAGVLDRLGPGRLIYADR